MQILQRATRVALALLVPVSLFAAAGLAQEALAQDAKDAKDAGGGKEGQKMAVADGRQVSIEYTLTVKGEVADTNVGGDPLTYTQGADQILPALEAQLVGLTAGDSKHVTLSPEQGYGPVNPELLQSVPAEQVPEDARVVGAQLVAQSQSGERRPVRVHAIEGDQIVMDLNHPLAGETLNFDVKILSVQ
jgi:FKBP-type peptidyl-prolyl cis-trans isomerase SlyD